jgi:tetrahydromethanopterin S-methyltransferase subunit F
VRWCWMEFPDLDAVDAFVSIIRLKHQLLARPE